MCSIWLRATWLSCSTLRNSHFNNSTSTNNVLGGKKHLSRATKVVVVKEKKENKRKWQITESTSADTKCRFCVYFMWWQSEHTRCLRQGEEGMKRVWTVKDNKKANVCQCKHACGCQWIPLWLIRRGWILTRRTLEALTRLLLHSSGSHRKSVCSELAVDQNLLVGSQQNQ